MIKNALIIALVVYLIYLYYQQKQTRPNFITGNSLENQELVQVQAANQTLTSFLRDQLNSNSLEELKTKLGEKNLDEILEENQDWETEVDTLTRTKNSLEQDLLAQSNAFQNRLREKDREIKKAKEDLSNLEKRQTKTAELLTSEKQQHKGSLERITKLTEQITSLEKERQSLTEALSKAEREKQELTNRPKSPMPGETKFGQSQFPEAEKTELEKTHQEQLRKINLLFDEKAQDYKEIDFNGLYSLLQTIKEQVNPSPIFSKKRKDKK